MNAARFFTQSASWRKRATSRPYGGDTFDPAQTIKVRWLATNEQVRTAEGDVITSAGQISTTTQVFVGDRVTDPGGTDREVMKVRPAHNTRGALSHYIAFLK